MMLNLHLEYSVHFHFKFLGTKNLSATQVIRCTDSARLQFHSGLVFSSMELAYQRLTQKSPEMWN